MLGFPTFVCAAVAVNHLNSDAIHLRHVEDSRDNTVSAAGIVVFLGLLTMLLECVIVLLRFVIKVPVNTFVVSNLWNLSLPIWSDVNIFHSKMSGYTKKLCISKNSKTIIALYSSLIQHIAHIIMSQHIPSELPFSLIVALLTDYLPWISVWKRLYISL